MNEFEPIPCESCRQREATHEVTIVDGGDGEAFDVCGVCVPRGRTFIMRPITRQGRRR